MVLSARARQASGHRAQVALPAAPGCRPGTPGGGRRRSPSENRPRQAWKWKVGRLEAVCGAGGREGSEWSQLGRLTATGSHALPPPTPPPAPGSAAPCQALTEQSRLPGTVVKGRCSPGSRLGEAAARGRGGARNRGANPGIKRDQLVPSPAPRKFPSPQEPQHGLCLRFCEFSALAARAACVLWMCCGKENQKGESVHSQRLSLIRGPPACKR